MRQSRAGSGAEPGAISWAWGHVGHVGPSLWHGRRAELEELCCRAAARQGAEERVPAGIFVGSRLSIKWNTVFITSSILVQ